ncbi:hypothetical protein N9H95_03205 [Gammaproteobacteria bacterium]|nr:hypothetical protein [Gammaproteobacteria bacterium]
MKKLFLTLLLISPLAKSEILELTCESAFPFWVSVNLDTLKGQLTYPELTTKDSYLSGIREYEGITEIRKFKIEGDYYVAYNGRIGPKHHHLFINRRNLKFYLRYSANLSVREGVCKKGIHELPEYQI